MAVPPGDAVLMVLRWPFYEESNQFVLNRLKHQSFFPWECRKPQVSVEDILVEEDEQKGMA